MEDAVTRVSLGIRVFAAVLALAVLGTVSGSAQYETNPDHFEFSNAEPLLPPKNFGQTTDTQYAAILTLPYAVECKGTNLAPGKYALSLRSAGNVGQATLNGQGREFGLQGLVREPDHSDQADALILEPSGNIHRLAAIHIRALDLVFDSARLREAEAVNPISRVDRIALIPRDQDKQ